MKLTVIKPLGSGGFGNVELVEDRHGQQFARKTFSVNQPLPDALVPNVRKRFIREAELQSGMNHRNIVRIEHTSLDGDAPWYLMPVAESTLERDIAASKTLDGHFPSAISDIISGLEELHSMQMFHRDLKPQNVLKFYDEDEDRYFYAISDFGFVSLKDSRLSKLTFTGMAKGTDYYTAPEITRDLRNASAQSDIYSLGCIIHDMVGNEDRVPCGEIRESGDFGALLLNCTRGRKERRFKSVTTVRDVLLSIDTDLPPIKAAEAVPLKELLDSNEELSGKNLKDLAEFIEDHEGDQDAAALLRMVTMERIDEFWQENAAETKRIGLAFAQWVTDNPFDFDYCDILANRLNKFIEHGDFDLISECLIALLKMGTSHNRWYVERTFMQHCGPNMDDGLAKRLAVEFRASGDETCRQIAHLELSISTTRNNLHPTLVRTLEEICG